MSTHVNCPSCRVSLQIRPETASRMLRCPRCKNKFRLGARGPVAAAAPAAAKEASRPAARSRPAPARAGGRPSTPPPADDINQTLLGDAGAPGRADPPPIDDEPKARRRSGKGGALRWALLGSLVTVLLIGGGGGGFYLWKSQTEARSGGVPPGPGGGPGPGSGQPAEGPGLGKWGAIEIGSKGIKALVIDVFEAGGDDGYDFSVVWQGDANPTLVAAGGDGRAFDPKALDAAEEHVRQFWTTMREKHNLPPERIYMVASSGLLVPFAKDADALEKNRAAVAARVKAATGEAVTFVKAQAEARLGMQASVPPKDWKAGVFIDIGSGNTKGGYFESDEVFESFDVDLGSVTYVTRVKKDAGAGKPFAEQVAALRPALLERPLREQIDRMPGLARQKKVHLAGGAVWALATFTHPNDTKPRVELTAADVERFAALVRRPESEVRNEVLAQVTDREQWQKVEKEIADVQKRFKPENLQAAAEILTALAHEFTFAEKKLYFFRKSHLAWALGYVLEKNRKK